MKTILSILEVLLYNLLPAVVAAPLIVLLKDVIPLMAISCMQVRACIRTWFEKLSEAAIKNYSSTVHSPGRIFSK